MNDDPFQVVAVDETNNQLFVFRELTSSILVYDISREKWKYFCKELDPLWQKTKAMAHIDIVGIPKKTKRKKKKNNGGRK